MAEDRNQKLPLFDRLGGRIFIALIAEKFSDRMYSDSWMDGLFNGIELDALKRAVTDMACEIFAGAEHTVRPALATVGERVPISQKQFNRGISHMIAAMVWAGITRELIEEALDLVTPLGQLLVRGERTDSDDDA